MTTWTKNVFDADPAQIIATDHLNRRSCNRWNLDGIATAFELDGNGFGRIHTLKRVECSDRALGAVTQEAVYCGTQVSIGFQDRKHRARFGSVVRCDQADEGFRLAVVFEQQPAGK